MSVLIPTAVTVPESRNVEPDAATKSRAYHDSAGKEVVSERRCRALARFATEFYDRRMHVQASSESRAVLDSLADPDTLLLEMAHDGQLPHLGIVRLVLKTHDIARIDRNAVTLYLVGNHYTAAMRPDNLWFGAPLKGRSPEDVKHPPKVRVGKAHAHTPFRWLPPPTAHDLEELRDQIADFVSNNVAHERTRQRLVPDAEDRIDGRLKEIFSLLTVAAREVESFGDWLIRVQHDLFHRMLGAEADRIVFLPMADLTDLVRPELTAIAEKAADVGAIKAAVSAEQIARGEEPYQREPQPSVFWVHCPTCFRRTRQRWRPGTVLDFTCPICKSHQALTSPDAWKWIMPDIVGYEVALFRLGIDGWVVGSHAPYHPVIEQTYARLFNIEMPPKFFLTSVPVFRGIGDPEEGYRRTRLLRALLEMEPSALAAALRAPWDEHPTVRSELLGPG
jgi:hypothetical protein